MTPADPPIRRDSSATLRQTTARTPNARDARARKRASRRRSLVASTNGASPVSAIGREPSNNAPPSSRSRSARRLLDRRNSRRYGGVTGGSSPRGYGYRNARSADAMDDTPRA